MNARKNLLRVLSQSMPLDQARDLVDRHHAEVVATHEAVATHGAFPMPTGDTRAPSRDLHPGAEVARRMIRDRQAEDSHDSPLHHNYTVSRDLPTGGAL